MYSDQFLVGIRTISSSREVVRVWKGGELGRAENGNIFQMAGRYSPFQCRDERPKGSFMCSNQFGVMNWSGEDELGVFGTPETKCHGWEVVRVEGERSVMAKMCDGPAHSGMIFGLRQWPTDGRRSDCKSNYPTVTFGCYSTPE